MQVLELAVDATTNIFETTKDGKVWVHIDTDDTFGTVTMQYSKSKDIDFADAATFYPDGSAETFTDVTTKLYDLPGGWFWRFSGSSTTANNYYVDGNHIKIHVVN